MLWFAMDEVRCGLYHKDELILEDALVGWLVE
jgi:hypothetical protein